MWLTSSTSSLTFAFFALTALLVGVIDRRLGR